MSPRFTAAGLGVAGCLLVGGWVIAVQEPPPAWELHLTSTINDAGAPVAGLLWPVMQLGSLVGPAVVAVGAYAWKRSALLSATVFASGVTAWFLAKGVKAVVERGRPLEYIGDITVREGAGTGLGFVSGHTAVAFACATALAPDLSPRARVVAYLGATTVGFSRIVYGVHFPADVLGGAGLGIVCGVGIRQLASGMTRFDRRAR